jgi:hypothetical protein
MKAPGGYIEIVCIDDVRMVFKREAFTFIPKWNVSNIIFVITDEGKCIHLDSRYSFYAVEDLRLVLNEKQMDSIEQVGMPRYYADPFSLLSNN